MPDSIQMQHIVQKLGTECATFNCTFFVLQTILWVIWTESDQMLMRSAAWAASQN